MDLKIEVYMEYLKASELSFCPRGQMGDVFADGFYQWLKIFSRDKKRLARALDHMFDLDRFYVAVENGKIAGFASCGQKPSPVSFDKRTLRKVLGFIRGSITYIALTKNLVNGTYPFELLPQTGSVEFVTVAPEFRGRGVAGGLVAHVMEVSGYSEFVLEVADTNTSAVKAYEKLGFEGFLQKPAPKGSGFNHFVYMKKSGTC